MFPYKNARGGKPIEIKIHLVYKYIEKHTI